MAGQAFGHADLQPSPPKGPPLFSGSRGRGGLVPLGDLLPDDRDDVAADVDGVGEQVVAAHGDDLEGRFCSPCDQSLMSADPTVRFVPGCYG
jgi:hypothetical protein